MGGNERTEVVERKELSEFFNYFIEYWWLLIRWSFESTVGLVDMKDRFKEVFRLLAVLIAIAFGVGFITKIIPYTIVEDIKNNALTTLWLGLFIIGMTLLEMFIIFVFTVLFIQPVQVYRKSMKYLDEYRKDERLAEAKEIHLEERKGEGNTGRWVGVAISNHEKNKSFLHPVFVLEAIDGYDNFVNPIELHKRGKPAKPVQLSPGGTACVYDIAFFNKPTNKVLITSLDLRETYHIPNGIYTLRTSLNGDFFNALEHIDPIKHKWLLTVSDNYLDLKKIEARE